MDFRTVVDNQSFGVRATGLLVKDEKLFLVRAPEGNYYTLGGAIQLGETTNEAVQREMREELGIDVEVGPLASSLKISLICRRNPIIRLNFFISLPHCPSQLPIWKKVVLFAGVSGLLLQT